MHVDAIELREIRVTLLSPFTTSFGTQQERPCVLVGVHADGQVGWGECVAGAGPWYSYETVETVWHVLSEFLVPMVLDQEIGEAADVWERFAAVRGHNMAKAGLEMACWDLAARIRGISLSTMLGGTRDQVPVGVSVGIHESPTALVETVRGFLDDGYARIKLKIGPGHDFDDVLAVRAAYPDAVLQVDANSAYTLEDAPLFQSLDQFDLLLVEQPLEHDDIIDHAQLQRQVRTPICLDESIHSPTDARHALDLGACRIINIKPGRVGGHTQSRRIEQLCHTRNVPVWCGGMFETNIGRAHNVAQASLPGFSLPGDISASARYYASDVAGPDFVLNADSTLTVPTGPGIGVEIDPTALARVTTRHRKFT